LLRNHPDIRRACGLHTSELCESHTDCDADRYSHGYSNSYGNSDGHGYSNTNCDIYSTAAHNPNTAASSHAAASPVVMVSGR
jgi:hypothetical protein